MSISRKVRTAGPPAAAHTGIRTRDREPRPLPADPALAARERVDALLTRFPRIDLQVMVVALPDATRLAARDRARAAAVAAGREDILDDAAAAARETTLRAFARAGFSGTWAATEMSMSVASANDRVAAAAAFEEAAMAEVVEDLVDEETVDALRATWNVLDRSTGMPTPGSLSALAAPPAGVARGPLQVAILVIILAGVVLWVAAGGVAFLLLALGVALVAWLAGQRTSHRS